MEKSYAKATVRNDIRLQKESRKLFSEKKHTPNVENTVLVSNTQEHEDENNEEENSNNAFLYKDHNQGSGRPKSYPQKFKYLTKPLTGG